MVKTDENCVMFNWFTSKTGEKIKVSWNFSILNLKIHLESASALLVLSSRKQNFNIFFPKKEKSCKMLSFYNCLLPDFSSSY